MYAIYGNIYNQYTPNVSIYTIHGSYGIGIQKKHLNLNHPKWSDLGSDLPKHCCTPLSLPWFKRNSKKKSASNVGSSCKSSQRCKVWDLIAEWDRVVDRIGIMISGQFTCKNHEFLTVAKKTGCSTRSQNTSLKPTNDLLACQERIQRHVLS
jgi:hypothetical protein